MKLFKKKAALIIIAVLAVAGGTAAYFFFKYRTYDHIEIIRTYEDTGTENASYRACLGGVLRYSRDGISLLTRKGAESWNQPCQMANPTLETCGESAAVGDRGGTSIYVLKKSGLKGEIRTIRPIEKFTVSSQGIVGAILKDEDTPHVMVYDAKGNVLVEHNVSFRQMGYPLDVSLSPDGNTLLVTYLRLKGEKQVSRIAYYYFGDEDAQDSNHLVYETELEDMVAPASAFLKDDISMIATDRALVFCKGLKKPKEYARVDIKGEIQSIGYGSDLVAVLVRKEDAYNLEIYNGKGKLVSRTDVRKSFPEIRVSGNKVILFDGQFCRIVLKEGICKYEGNMDENIIEIFPVFGFNKYMMVSTDGFGEIRLAN